MKEFIKRLSRILIKYRFAYLAATLAVSIFFIWQIRSLISATSIGYFHPLRHPYLAVQDKLTHLFGPLNKVSIVIEVKPTANLISKDESASIRLHIERETVFNPQTLKKVWQITYELYSAEGINTSRVVSLAARRIKNIKANAEGFVAESLMSQPPKDDEEADAFFSKVVADPFVFGTIVSKDLKSTLIQVDFASGISVRKIFAFLKDLKSRYQDRYHNIYISGQPVLRGCLDAYLPKIAGIFVFTILIISLFLFNAFKSKRGVVLPILSACLSLLWGLGLSGLLGFRLTPSLVLGSFLVFALCINHSAQFMQRYYDYLKAYKGNSKAAGVKTIRDLFFPASTAILADGIAPFTLFFVPLNTVRSLAVAVGFGALSMFFNTLLLMPVLLSFMPPAKRLQVIHAQRKTLASTIIRYFTDLTTNMRSRYAIFAVFCALILTNALGLLGLAPKEKSQGRTLLYGNAPYNQAERFISDRFAASGSYYVFVSAGNQGTILKSDVLKEMDSLERYLERSVLGLARTFSFAEYIKRMNMITQGGKPDEFRIPPDDRLITELLLRYSLVGSLGDFDPVVSRNYQFANIKVDLKNHNFSTIRQLLEKTKRWIRIHHKSKEINFLYAGGDIGMLAAENQLTGPMPAINSLGIVIIVLFFLIVAFG